MVGVHRRKSCCQTKTVVLIPAAEAEQEREQEREREQEQEQEQQLLQMAMVLARLPKEMMSCVTQGPQHFALEALLLLCWPYWVKLVQS